MGHFPSLATEKTRLDRLVGQTDADGKEHSHTLAEQGQDDRQMSDNQSPALLE